MTECVKIKCDDCKFVENCVDYGWDGCRKFTPKPSEPMTNEEYIRSCSTEQLAEELHEHFMWGVSVNAENGFTQEFMDKTKKHIVEWLKEIHE